MPKIEMLWKYKHTLKFKESILMSYRWHVSIIYHISRLEHTIKPSHHTQTRLAVSREVQVLIVISIKLDI